MEEYIKEHQKYLLSAMNNEKVKLEDLLEYHQQQIEWIQHERLVHLLVMIFVIVLFLFFFTLFYIYDGWQFTLLIFILFVLMVFYIKHYYFLENSVQKWYEISNQLSNKISGIGVEKI